MAGRNFLFVPGPTNVPDRIQRAMVVSMEDHRSPHFPVLTNTIMTGLKSVYRTKVGTPFVFPSSGTGCWEAALTNTLSPGDTVLASLRTVQSPVDRHVRAPGSGCADRGLRVGHRRAAAAVR